MCYSHLGYTETVAGLSDVISGKLRNDSGVGDMTTALNNAEEMLRNIRYRNFIEKAIGAGEEQRYIIYCILSENRYTRSILLISPYILK